MHFIDYCQPYRGVDGPGTHALSGLRKLSNEDKHRALLPAYSAIDRPTKPFEIDIRGVRDIESVEPGQLYAGRPLKSGDLVLDAPVTISGPNPEVKVEGTIPMDVGFGWKPVPLGGLRQMVHLVAHIVGTWGRAFFGE